jgi:hypothetical protein
MVLVSDPIFVKRWRSGRLNATEDPLLGQDREGVVHRLSRDGTDLGANVFQDFVRPAVGPSKYRPQHG